MQKLTINLFNLRINNYFMFDDTDKRLNLSFTQAE